MSEVKVPEGYKQTEVEVIPEDWKVTTIGDFAPLQRGFDLPTTKVEAGDYPVVYSNGIVRNHKDFQVKGAGIVTGRSGTIGKVHYIESDFWPHNTTLWVTSFGNAHVKFVYYLFKYIGFERFKSGSGVPTLNRNDAHSFKITVPTKVDEQTAIATALSDVDNLIQSLEKLIAKKEAIKTGTMQHLLTGKTRLPEFATHENGSAKGFKQTELGRIPEDWKVVSLGEAVEFLDGQRKPIKASDRAKINGIYPYYGASGIVDYVNDYIFDEDLILLGEDGDNILSRNSPLSFKVSGKIWVNNHAHVLRPNQNFNITFLTSFLESLDYALLNSGTAQPKLNKATCLKIKVAKPSKNEQTAIATVLSDMDAEIQALQQRLDKTRDIKQGMMQQLLTGKVRLAH